MERMRVHAGERERERVIEKEREDTVSFIT